MLHWSVSAFFSCLYSAGAHISKVLEKAKFLQLFKYIELIENNFGSLVAINKTMNLTHQLYCEDAKTNYLDFAYGFTTILLAGTLLALLACVGFDIALTGV